MLEADETVEGAPETELQAVSVHGNVKLGVPVVGVVDTNHSPEGIDYIIPGNDDSSRAIRLYARGIADAVLEGRTQSLEETVAASRDEFVEVEEDEGDK